MKRNFCLLAALIMSLMFNGMSLRAQQISDPVPDKAFIDWAKSQLYPLQNIDTIKGDQDLKPLNSLIGNARVVALGEPAHGFHETLSFRNRMFQYLVGNLGFTSIALEANFAKARAVSDYINGKASSAEQAAGALTIGDATGENVELIRWMRTYNQDPAHKTKIKFYGMDMELMGFPGDTRPSHPAIDEALAYLTRVDEQEANSIRKALTPFLDRLSTANYPLLSAPEQDKLSAILDDLIMLFERERLRFTVADTKPAYELAYRNAIVARQTDRMVRLLPPGKSDEIPADGWRSMNFRDSSMAENVLWMVNQGEKVFVYAHNAHVKNAPTTGSVWDIYASPPNATGQYLRSVLKNELVIFGISAVPPGAKQQPGNLETTLAGIGKPNFLLDLRKADSYPIIKKWLDTPRPMQANIVTYLTLNVRAAFDVIVYMNKLSPANQVR